MKWAPVIPLAILAAAPLLAVPPTKHKVSSTKAPIVRKVNSASGSSRARRPAGSSGRATLTKVRYVKGRRGQASRYVRAAPRPSYQTQPDPERYQEIQKALAGKGYFNGDANGEWNADSADALKRFQADQKLEADGKINAHTLTGLGLGPKHNGTLGNTNLVPIVEPPPEPVSAPPASLDEPAPTPE